MRAAKHKIVAATLLVCLIPAVVCALPGGAAAQQAPVPPPPYGGPAPPAPPPAPPPPYGDGPALGDTRGELTTGQRIMFWSGTAVATAGFVALIASFFYMDLAIDNSREIERRYGDYGESDRWDAEAQAIEDEGRLAQWRFQYLLGGGLTLLIVGSLMITSGRIRPKKKQTLSIAPTEGGAMLGWTAAF